jgi:hypothetical protein
MIQFTDCYTLGAGIFQPWHENCPIEAKNRGYLACCALEMKEKGTAQPHMKEKISV